MFGTEDIEDDGEPVDRKMIRLSNDLYGQMREAERLDSVIRRKLEELGFGV